jgi:hypothetical protein
MHCDQRVTRLGDSFMLGSEVCDRAHYTGYVIEQQEVDCTSGVEAGRWLFPQAVEQLAKTC